jgi:hemoglobin
MILVPALNTDFARLGGWDALRTIMDAFVARLPADVMIGFLFTQVPLKRLGALETAYAAGHLGGPAYKGPDLAVAHAKLGIAGGHFARRRRILAETLVQAGVPQDITARWLAHQDNLRPLILGGPKPTACPADDD